MMHAAILLAAVLLFVPPASAQTPSHGGLLPYTFAAPGVASAGGATLHLGGGIEAIAATGLGAGVELGFIGPFPDGFGHGLGVLSGNLSAHLPSPADRRLTPFVTGGYSLGFRSSRVHLLNVGAGMHYWINEGLAVRLELRDQFSPVRRSCFPHLVSVRVGVTWKL